MNDFDRAVINLGLSNDAGSSIIGNTNTATNPIVATNNSIATKKALVPNSSEIEFSSASIFPDVKALQEYLKKNKLAKINWLHVGIAGAVGIGAGYLIAKNM